MRTSWRQQIAVVGSMQAALHHKPLRSRSAKVHRQVRRWLSHSDKGERILIPKRWNARSGKEIAWAGLGAHSNDRANESTQGWAERMAGHTGVVLLRGEAGIRKQGGGLRG
jgi:hypothetical protein